MEFPKTTFDWANISELLEQRGQLTLILDKVEEVKKRKERERLASMTDEEKAIEEAKWKKIREDTDPFKFYGNMGQPETAQEFKNRYGVWPPGYDENGIKYLILMKRNKPKELPEVLTDDILFVCRWYKI